MIEKTATVETKVAAPLAIASITAVLRDILANGLIRYASLTRLGDVNVTVLSPDRVTVGADEPNQLNLFLYRVGPHSRLRVGGGARTGGDDRGPSRPSLPLDLHYLVTAYGAQDFHSEILLGCAVHLLGSTPVLTGDMIHEALQRPLANGKKGVLSPAREALSSAPVSESGARLEVTQEFLAFEEMSKLWSVLQARYRPSVAYQVSAVNVPLEG